MKNTFLLLFAFCLSAQLSFGQDRRDGLVRLTTDRDEAREIHRDVMRTVNRDINRSIRYAVVVDARGWRDASRYDVRYRPYGNHYYRWYPRHQVRDEIRREMRRTRDEVRQAVPSARRFWRE